MESSNVTGRIILSTLVQSHYENRDGNVVQQDISSILQPGQTSLARVISINADGSLLLELAGQQFEATGIAGLTPNQTLNVRIDTLQPNLILEILGERTPVEQRLTEVLKTLFSTKQNLASSMENLSKALNLIQTSTQSITIGKDIADFLNPVQVGNDGRQLASDLKQIISQLGLGLESNLRAMVTGDVDQLKTQVEGGLKSLLGQLLAALKHMPVKQNQPLSSDQILDLMKLIDRFDNRWQGIPGSDARDRFKTIISGLKRNIQALGSGSVTEGIIEDQMRAVFTSGRREFTSLAKTLTAQRGNVFSRSAEQLLLDLEIILSRTEEGKNILLKFALNEVEKSATQIREKLEALQIFNAHIGEKDQFLQFMFPVSLMDELTEVQIKQLLTDKGKKGGKILTIVMLLNLESLGKIRMDVLMQEKKLYCNIFVQKREVGRLVNEMLPVFAKQLKVRGFSLGRLKCIVDTEKIDQFHQLEGDFLSEDEGLIDLRI